MKTLMEMVAESIQADKRHAAAVQRVRRAIRKALAEGRALPMREIAEQCKLTEPEAKGIAKRLLSGRGFRYGRSNAA